MTTSTIASRTSLQQRVIIGLATFLVGSFIVFGVGLAQDARLHNAAHDTRHAIGFPCH